MYSSHTMPSPIDDKAWRKNLENRNSRDLSPLPVSNLDEGSSNYFAPGGGVSSSYHKRSLSSNMPTYLPPPPPPSSGSSPVVPIYRKHSRKKSSQVLVPPIQIGRKRSVRQTPSDGDLAEGGLNITTNEKRDGSSIKRSSFIDKSDTSSDEERSRSGSGSGRRNGIGIIEADENDDQAGSANREREKKGEEVDEIIDYIEDDGDSNTHSITTKTLTSGATFLIFAQFFSKLITFSLNQLLLKFVSPSLLGMNAQFELFTNTILFFSREAIRLATQRQTLVGKSKDSYRFEGGVAHNTHSGTIQEVINIGFIPFVVGIPISLIISLTYYHYWSSKEYIGTSIIILAISSLVELASEPSFVFLQLLLDFKTRASIESAAITIRCLIIFIFILLSRKSFDGTIIFLALGQLAYSIVTSGLYFLNSLKITRHQPYRILYLQGVWKESNQEKIFFNPATKKLAIGMWLQTIFKHLLTEGDKLLVSILLPINEQGVYALVANYGSLIARLGFLPIEEALRSFFSKLLAEEEIANSSINTSINTSAVATPITPSISTTLASPSLLSSSFASPSIMTSPSLASPSNSPSLSLSPSESSRSPSPTPATSLKQSDLNLSITILSSILRIYTYFNIIISIFGPLASSYVLSILVSSTWLSTDAPKVLATYALYIPFLAINGCLEAFVQSVASVEDLKDQGRIMIFFSFSFAIAGYIFMVLLHLGAQGLIFANMLNMLLRIIWCSRFITNYYTLNPLKTNPSPYLWLKQSIPNKMILTATSIITAISYNLGTIKSFQDFIKQSLLASSLLVVILYYEKDLITSLNKARDKKM